MATSPTTRLKVEIKGPVARITLSNPPLNIIDVPMMLELEQQLSQIETSTEISTVVFEGSARAFSAGVDIKAHVPEQIHEMLGSFHAVIRAIVASRTITIASVRGICLGGGAELDRKSTRLNSSHSSMSY